MIWFILFVFCLDFVLITLLIAGWHKAVGSSDSDGSNIHGNFVTVIVPFRNEKANLAAIIESLSRQTKRDFEVLLVDDHSDDGSADLVRQLISGKKNFALLSSLGVGKKKAITTAVSAAKGDIIVTTDADCIASERWLESMNQPFFDKDIKLVFAPVQLQPGKGDLFGEMQAIEFMSVMGTGAAAFQLGHPLYCNGANLAFRRDVFLQLNGYEGNFHVPSGDDEFLLRKILAAFPQGVKWQGDMNAIIKSRPQVSVSDFFHQRVRWAGKWKYSSTSAKVLAFTVLAVQLSVLTSFILLANGVATKPLILVLLAKMLLEYVFLFNIGRYFSRQVRFLPFIATQFLYPFYVVGIGILSNFLIFRWKGRRLRTSESASSHF